jgi:hypothetical protein
MISYFGRADFVGSGFQPAAGLPPGVLGSDED